MDRAVDAAAAQKAYVGRIDDRIDVEAGDVALDDFDAHRRYQVRTGPVSMWTKPERG